MSYSCYTEVIEIKKKLMRALSSASSSKVLMQDKALISHIGLMLILWSSVLHD
jgi:hypothetical protein